MIILIWTCPSRFVLLFCPFCEFADVVGFSRSTGILLIVLFLFVGPLKGRTTNIPERVPDTISTFQWRKRENPLGYLLSTSCLVETIPPLLGNSSHNFLLSVEAQRGRWAENRRGNSRKQRQKNKRGVFGADIIWTFGGHSGGRQWSKASVRPSEP